MSLFREYYQKDNYTPLSWEKLNEIAMQEIFSGYLKKDQNGEWQINDGFFDDIVHKNINTTGYDECFECKTEEEYVMYMVRKNWRQRDTKKVTQLACPRVCNACFSNLLRHKE